MTWRWLYVAAVALGAIAVAAPARADWFTRPVPQVARGNDLFAKKKYAQAQKAYEEAAKAHPNDARVHLNRALALMAQGEDKLDEAMQALHLAASLEAPKEVRARIALNMGNAFFQKGDYAEAIRWYKKSLLLHPGDKRAAWNLELAKQRQREEQERKKQQQDQDKQNQGEQGEQDTDQQSQQDRDTDQDDTDQDDTDRTGTDRDQTGGDTEDNRGGDTNDSPKDTDSSSDARQSPASKDTADSESESARDQSSDTAARQPTPAPRPDDMERILNAIDREGGSFQKHKARHRLQQVGTPAVEKDW